MNNRVISDSENTVNLFPFLAVLLCTMGALLVLLVVLAQRAGERALAESEPGAEVPAVFEETQSEPEQSQDAEQIAKLTSHLEKVVTYTEELEDLRQQAAKKLRAEQDKLTHLEEHTRRMEHELARLSVAADQLAATEENQIINQEQAEQELLRLQQLIVEQEEQVEKLKEEVKGKRSYAIAPFHGKDGTTAPRIYIECSGKGVTVQPEGLVLDVDDFRVTDWAGNPLAQVVRATQQHLKESIASESETGHPLAVPLLIVRPDGIRALNAAQDALDAAEIEYGFDHVGGTQSLTYPVAVDPILAEKQHQARMIARRQLIVQIESAPRRYKKMLESLAVGARGIGVGTSAAKQALFERLATPGSSVADSQGTDIQLGSQGEAGFGAKEGFGQEGEQLGALNESGDSPGMGDTAVPDGHRPEQDLSAGSIGGSSQGDGEQQFGLMEAEQVQVAGAAGASANSASSSGALRSGVSMAGENENNYGISGEFKQKKDRQPNQNQVASPLVERTPNAVPMQRPIQVIVRKDQIAIMPDRHASQTNAASGANISLNQSTKKFAAELKVAIRDQVKDWGIAGRGLYWKPVLHFKVAPDATETALALEKMLSRGGLAVNMPEQVRLSKGGQDNASR